MIVNHITELTLVGILDRGIPNQERLAFRSNQYGLNLGRYGIMIGVRADAGMAFPIKDNLFWFGDAVVNFGDWVFVYTGPGQPRNDLVPNTQERIYSIHWGRAQTVFDSPTLTAILFRTDAAQVLQQQPLLLPPA